MTRQSFTCNMASAGFWLLTALAMPVIIGAAYLVWNSSLWGALAAVFPVLLMAHAIRVARTIKKYDGETSLQTRVCVYSVDIVLPYIWIALCSMFGLMPIHTVFVYLTLPVAIACERAMKKISNSGAELIEDLKVRTLNLFCMFASMLALTFVLARFL